MNVITPLPLVEIEEIQPVEIPQKEEIKEDAEAEPEVSE
jgi:hypothetical protein